MADTDEIRCNKCDKLSHKGYIGLNIDDDLICACMDRIDKKQQEEIEALREVDSEYERRFHRLEALTILAIALSIVTAVCSFGIVASTKNLTITVSDSIHAQP